MRTEPAKFLAKFYIFKIAQSHVDVGKQTKDLAGTERQSLLPSYTSSSKLLVLLQAVSYYAVKFLANIRDALKYVPGTTY